MMVRHAVFIGGLGWAFLLLHGASAAYTCGTNNCWNADGNCCRDANLLYSGRASDACLCACSTPPCPHLYLLEPLLRRVSHCGTLIR